MTDQNDGQMDDELSPRVRETSPGSRQNRWRAAASVLTGNANKILIVVAIALIVLVVTRSIKSEPTPTQNLGVKPPKASQASPNETADYVADKVKERDRRAADYIAGSKKEYDRGTGYMPEVTREWEDPLADYAAATSASQITETSIGSQVPDPQPAASPPPPRRQSSGANAEADPRATAMANAMLDLDRARQTRLALKNPIKLVEREAPLSKTPAVQDPLIDAARAAPRHTDVKRYASLGEMIYAVMDFEANSDYSKFVQATAIAGRFAGAKFQGSFRRTRDRLEIVFSKVHWKGKTLAVSAIAANPENPEIGLATEVNQHYLARYGGVILAAMAGSAATELAREGTTVTRGPLGDTEVEVPNRTGKDILLIAGADGVGELAGDLRAGMNRPPTVIVAATTPIVLVLTADWVDDPSAGVMEGGTLRAETDEGLDPTLPPPPPSLNDAQTVSPYQALVQARRNQLETEQ